MSVILKKLALSLFTDRKVLKTVGGIILGILVMIAMPIAAVTAVFSGDIKLDLEELKARVEAEIPDHALDGSRVLSEKLDEISEAMTQAGLAEYASSAQNISIVFLSDHMTESDFAIRLAGCYQKGQTNESFLSVLNETFGMAISAEDLLNVAGDQTVETEEQTEEETEDSKESAPTVNESKPVIEKENEEKMEMIE
jgi:septal ring-binding cell division protein DamX